MSFINEKKRMKEQKEVEIQEKREISNCQKGFKIDMDKRANVKKRIKQRLNLGKTCKTDKHMRKVKCSSGEPATVRITYKPQREASVAST